MNNNNVVLRILVSFVLGVGLGSVGGFFAAKSKYLKQADKEIESVKVALRKHYAEKLTAINPEDESNPSDDPIIEDQPKEDQSLSETEEKAFKDFDKETKEKYIDYAKRYNGANVENKPKAPKKKLKETVQEIINESEFNNSEFVAQGFTYYVENDLFVNDHDVPLPVDDNTFEGHIKDLIKERANNKGTYRPETIYVRDASRKVDYEINFEYSLKFVPNEESA